MEDQNISPVMKWLEKGVRPVGPKVAASSPATQHYWLYWESLKLIEGVLFHKFSRKDGTGEHTQFIVPRKLRDEIGHQMHNSLLSGHLDKCKTMEWVIQHFYWCGVREDCDLWVEKCDMCISKETSTKTLSPTWLDACGGANGQASNRHPGPPPTNTKGKSINTAGH